MSENSTSEILKAVGDRLRKVRTDLDLSQSQIADALDLGRSTITKLEKNGNASPDVFHGVIREIRKQLSSRTGEVADQCKDALNKAERVLASLQEGQNINAKTGRLPSRWSRELEEALTADAESNTLRETLNHLAGLVEKGLFEAALVDVLYVLEGRTNSVSLSLLTRHHLTLTGVLRSCRQAITPEALAQLVIRASRGVLEKPLDITDGALEPELVKWLTDQQRLAQLMVPARSRLKGLKWHGPYKGNWRFIDQDSSQDLSEPAHGYWGHHAFLRDTSDNALHTLYTRRYSYNDERLRASHRVADIVPRMLLRLLQTRSLAYNMKVACGDVAPTHLNPTIRIRPAAFFDCYVGTYSVGTDAYSDDGVREFDGTSLIQEDGQWLLLRSNHSAKPFRVAVLMVSKDGYLIITLQEPDSLSGSAIWSATAVDYAHPQDFQGLPEESTPAIAEAAEREGDRLLVTAIEAAARRIAVRAISKGDNSDPLPEDIDISITGFALDAAMGLQPVWFAVARAKTLNGKALADRLELHGTVSREFPLVEDNPVVSFEELLGLPRYEQAEMLSASLFFAAHWLSAIARNQPGAPATLHDIGLDRAEVLRRIQPASEYMHAAVRTEEDRLTAGPLGGN